MDRIPITQDGYDRLKADLERMETKEMIEITKRVAAARDLGDLSENAEYHAAREDQGMLQARINSLKSKLSLSCIVNPNEMPQDIVAFGACVVICDLDLGGEETFHLVGPGDEDYDNNKILTTSPVGQGLMGKKAGDTVEIAVPVGKLRFKIIKIGFEDAKR